MGPIINHESRGAGSEAGGGVNRLRSVVGVDGVVTGGVDDGFDGVRVVTLSGQGGPEAAAADVGSSFAIWWSLRGRIGWRGRGTGGVFVGFVEQGLDELSGRPRWKSLVRSSAGGGAAGGELADQLAPQRSVVQEAAIGEVGDGLVDRFGGCPLRRRRTRRSRVL